MIYDELLEEYNAWTDVIDYLQEYFIYSAGAYSAGANSFICSGISAKVGSTWLEHPLATRMANRLKSFAEVEKDIMPLWFADELSEFYREDPEIYNKLTFARVMACQLMQFEIEQEMEECENI